MIALPATFTNEEKQRMRTLVGAATVQINDRSTSDNDRRDLQELVGLLASVVFHETVITQLATYGQQIQRMELQLATLQRGASTS